jgi:hypothetical protein
VLIAMHPPLRYQWQPSQVYVALYLRPPAQKQKTF